MHIQVNTDNNISGREALVQRVEETLNHVLARFAGQITRVEVHLSDENSTSKSGGIDKRCMLEARLKGQQPVAVTDHSATLEQAVHGASQKLVHLLDTTLGRMNDHRENTSGLPLSGTDPNNWSDSPVE